MVKKGFGKADSDKFDVGEAWKEFAAKAQLPEKDIARVAIDIQSPCDNMITDDKAQKILEGALADKKEDVKEEAPEAPAAEEKPAREAKKPVAQEAAPEAPAPQPVADPVRTLQQALVKNGFRLAKTRTAEDGVDGKYGRDTDCKTKGAVAAILDRAKGLLSSEKTEEKEEGKALFKKIDAALDDLKDGKPNAETATFIATELDKVDDKTKQAHNHACEAPQKAERHTEKPTRRSDNQVQHGAGGGHRRRGGGGHSGIDYGSIARRVTESQGYVSANTVRHWHEERGLDPRNPKWDTSIAQYGRDHTGQATAEDGYGIPWKDSAKAIEAGREYSAKRGHKVPKGAAHRYVDFNPFGGENGQKEITFTPPEYNNPEQGGIGVSMVPTCKKHRGDDGGCGAGRGGGGRRYRPGHIRHIPDAVSNGGSSGSPGASSGNGGPGGGSSCFIAGTTILMADGSYKPVELLEVGDVVKGQGRDNTVIATPTIPLAGRELYSFNDGEAFVTAGHPFMTDKGWSAIDPSQTVSEKHGVIARKLEVGDILFTETGTMLVQSINLHQAVMSADAQMVSGGSYYMASEHSFVYNPMLDGDHTYYADGYLVHNKGGGQ